MNRRKAAAPSGSDQSEFSHLPRAYPLARARERLIRQNRAREIGSALYEPQNAAPREFRFWKDGIPRNVRFAVDFVCFAYRIGRADWCLGWAGGNSKPTSASEPWNLRPRHFVSRNR